MLKLQVSPSQGKKKQNRLSSGKLVTSFLLLYSSHWPLPLLAGIVVVVVVALEPATLLTVAVVGNGESGSLLADPALILNYLMT